MEKTKAPEGAQGLVRPNFTMSDCPKYQGCNAPICPLDTDWRMRSGQKEDATCFYLTESVKRGAETYFEGAGLGTLYAAIVLVRPSIAANHKRINSALERAKLTGSRMARKIGGDHVR